MLIASGLLLLHIEFSAEFNSSEQHFTFFGELGISS